MSHFLKQSSQKGVSRWLIDEIRLSGSERCRKIFEYIIDFGFDTFSKNNDV